MKDKSPAARQYVNINHVGNTLLINHFVGKKMKKKKMFVGLDQDVCISGDNFMPVPDFVHSCSC